MRIPVIGGNWKMNTTLSEAESLVKELLPLGKIHNVETILCPPFISITRVNDLIKDSGLKLGAQNMYYEKSGAYTGEVSSLMLVGLCEYVILGHSERRQYFGETDDIVNRKVKAALEIKLKTIICVGEKLEENEKGLTEAVVTRQIKGAFSSINNPPLTIVVAYEPIWAIGTGKAATGEQANRTVGVIRSVIAGLYGKSYADLIRIQYGGSTNAKNIAEFIQQPEIDGALVGGASLKASDFISMVEQTARIKDS